MSEQHNPERRGYRAPRREASAARTRIAVLTAAQHEFEERGWAGATVRAIAARADVSPKTVEALYGSKGKLLGEAVTFAIRGDAKPERMLERAHVLEMERTPTAGDMLERHAAHLRVVNERSARLAGVVEAAAAADPEVARLWRQMNENRRVGIRWAVRTLLAKPDAPAVHRKEAESTFLVAFDWGTYRVLTQAGGLSPAGYQRWLERFYERMLLGRH